MNNETPFLKEADTSIVTDAGSILNDTDLDMVAGGDLSWVITSSSTSAGPHRLPR